ncbi:MULTISPECIES: DUF262 domain-containing protein [Aeromonas]|uniref:DUF262 domain-containing protein n=1 Tax=Aeromonas TaxID=642 RepID=UPI0005A84605|nr:DUF262 domain-containing protein [Aeromonas caviae]MBS4635126.1 DUF262 domain-containing protein [Aeromonas caviae]MDH0140469.1 DUF262 domain-containing HNH endonuclease family protein [Aeromonas caviae]MDX7840248.1 DUF262 domain-containing HNH endonuclease family protein [Aeromonas caviae]WQD87535.1 DUF262 domain-containing HNH endonuclease family protein [Aeromonas caviae]SQH60003.1 Uncharacterized conserved protein [Aeromonas caviae]
MQHESKLTTLADIIADKRLFNIPIYQRLYVWGSDQIKVLLDDLVAACEADKDVFYLGGTLVIEQGRTACGHPLLDLIDGQQRFTTLWLLSVVMERLLPPSRDEQTAHNPLTDFRCAWFGDNREPRIRFAIRPGVSRFFTALLDGRAVPDEPQASALSYAMQVMEGYFSDRTDERSRVDLVKLGRFIRERVQLVLTRVPANTDLNKLFEVINNRGVQLQHHEILKARLLALLPERSEREVYGQMWDACSFMGAYVEKNLRTVKGLKLIPLYDADEAKRDQERLADPLAVRDALLALDNQQDIKPHSLEEILNGAALLTEPSSGETRNEEEYEADDVRSVIGFPMLLQHVLRLFLLRSQRDDINKILDKELLQIFQSHWLEGLSQCDKQKQANEVRYFIELLWRCRYLFDKHVIKWISDENNEENHGIRRLRVNESRGYRSLIRDSRDAESNFAMLQSMLYHSQQLTTHYWLTPLLNYLLDHGGENAHCYLQYLDNHLLCSESEQPLIVRTREFVLNPWSRAYPLRDMQAVLTANEGTDFSHYWFYKLEYILWDRYRTQKGSAWQAFRMTARNSVEHVSPQQPESFDTNQVAPELRDCFGNLGLVSRSINSEYGNKPYAEKRARFRERNAARVDSLKLALIYEHEQWNGERAQAHQQKMIEEYQKYFAAVERYLGTIGTSAEE